MKPELVVVIFGLLMGCTPAPPATGSSPEAASPVQPVGLDVYRGSAIAQMVCVQCHDIGIAGLPPETQVNAPAFPEVASRGGATSEQLKRWIRTTHPIMPTFMFSEGDVADLAAYIMSLHHPD